MAPIGTFDRRKTDTEIEEKKYSTAIAWKELIDTVHTIKDD